MGNINKAIIVMAILLIGISVVSCSDSFVFLNTTDFPIVNISNNGNVTALLDFCILNGNCLSSFNTDSFVLKTGDDMTGNLNSTGNITTTNWFNGLFNWTTLTNWLSFDGATLSFNETKLNSSIDSKISEAGITTYWNQSSTNLFPLNISKKVSIGYPDGSDTLNVNGTMGLTYVGDTVSPIVNWNAAGNFPNGAELWNLQLYQNNPSGNLFSIGNFDAYINGSADGQIRGLSVINHLQTSSTPAISVPLNGRTEIETGQTGDWQNVYGVLGEITALGSSNGSGNMYSLAGDTNIGFYNGYFDGKIASLYLDEPEKPLGNNIVASAIIRGAVQMYSNKKLIFDGNSTDLGDSSIYYNSSESKMKLVEEGVESNLKSFPTYDATVCSSGCDYTDVATAFSTEGADKRYYITGEFTFSSVATIPNDTYVFWDRVSVLMESGGQLTNANSYRSKMDGIIDVTIDGGISYKGSFIGFVNTAYDCDYSGLDIDVTSESSLAADGDGTFIRFDGMNCQHGKVNVHDIEFAYSSTTATLRVVAFNGHKTTMENIIIKDVFQSGTGVTRLAGIVVEGGNYHTLKSASISGFYGVNTANVDGIITLSDYNEYHLIIDGVVTTSGNNGIGINNFGGSDYNAFFGVSRNCDKNNFANGGTGTFDGVAN